MSGIKIKFILIVLVIAGLFAYQERFRVRDFVDDMNKPTLPVAITIDEVRETLSASGNIEEDASVQEPVIKKETETTPVAEVEEIPEVEEEEPTTLTEFNLAVPFTVQSPFATWDELHGEACEEASAIMVHAFLEGETSLTPEVADERILSIVEFEKERFGYYLDTNVEDTAIIMREYHNIESAKVVAINSIQDVKNAVAKGFPVIVPAYGRALGNPYFRGEGPLYHMLVVKGFIGTDIITNDPGTKRGADFLYNEEVLWKAIGDWNDGNPAYGDKVMITVN